MKSGHHSVRCRTHGETMHIGTGPRIEAMALHVVQQRLLERSQARADAASGDSRPHPFVIWDVGLGPAGNALVTIDALRAVSAPVEIHSFDQCAAVLQFALNHAAELDYLHGWEAPTTQLLSEGNARPLPHVRWFFHQGDFRERLHEAPPPEAIFHDPYSPARNPELWSLEVFEAMKTRADAAPGPCLLTNYTRSTAARVTLALAGWHVGIGTAIGEKDETTIACSHPGHLERPLDRAWLARVRASSNGAAIRNGLYARGPIHETDLARLAAMAAFQ